MVIIRIERLRSRQARYRVRFDDGEPIVIAEDLLIRFGLASGDEVSETLLREIEEANESVAAKQKAYHYISFRPRSRHELERFLVRKGFSRGRAEMTASEFGHLGLVDDETFAAMVVRDAINRGRVGPAAIRKKLTEKGIAQPLIESLIDENFTDALLASKAIALLQKRVERTRHRLLALEPRKRRARLYQYLCQRGFSSQTAIHALNSIEV